MGKPSASHVALPYSEYIAIVEGTKGTETSQYLEEKKSTESPLVAASEKGSAKTYPFLLFIGVASIITERVARL